MLRPGGRIAFYTIFIPQGLAERDYRRAARVGAPGVTSWRREQPALLRAAGFSNVSQTDVTPEYLRLLRAWTEARERHAAGLREADGEAAFAEKQRENRARLAAIEAGLLRRCLLVAERGH